MLKKVLKVMQLTAIMWMFILVPLIAGYVSIKSASETDIVKYMDSYLDNEATNLSKYISLQLKNSSKELLEISDAVIYNTKDVNTDYEEIFSNFFKNNTNIVNISLYDTKGLVIYKSVTDDTDAIDVTDFSIIDLKDKDCSFYFKQDDNGAVLINFTMKRDKVKNVDPFYMVVTMKWSQYEHFLDRLQEGAFSRKFYIVTPDCRRYLSLNSLPRGEESNRNLVALGLHLAEKIKGIKLGISDVELEQLKYRVFKSEIKSPEKVDGSQMFIIAVTDREAFEKLTEGMFKRVPTVIVILLFIWLIVCLFISRFVNHAKEQLSISDAISESTPSAIIVFAAETGKIRTINPSGLTLTRLSTEKTSEVNAWELFVSEKDRNYIMNAMKSDIHIVNYEVLVQSYAGNTFWSICSANPLVINIGMEPKVFVVLSILDINKRKEIEKKLANNAELLEKQVAERTADLEIKAKELEESNKKLDQAKLQADSANAAKTKFLTNMSIELKTPINAIIGYSEILQEEAMDRKDNVSAEDLAKIIRSAKHLLSLINEILDLSSIESGKTQLFFETISIESLIKEVEGVSMPLITKNENAFFCEYPKDIGEMYVDQTKLRQCILNLIDNASKFTEFGKITLRASPIVKSNEEFIEFSVTDTGTGIASDKLNTIFSSFQEESNSQFGTGLGLSITTKYVECMGGNISVESELGVGSKFIIRLPRICKVESSEFVEIKNHKDEEASDIFDEQSNTTDNFSDLYDQDSNSTLTVKE